PTGFAAVGRVRELISPDVRRARFGASSETTGLQPSRFPVALLYKRRPSSFHSPRYRIRRVSTPRIHQSETGPPASRNTNNTKCDRDDYSDPLVSRKDVTQNCDDCDPDRAFDRASLTTYRIWP